MQTQSDQKELQQAYAAMYLPSGGQVDIPVLKEKEKERRGAGVPAYAGAGGGPSGAVLGSNSLRVGVSVMQPGFLGSARVAAALSRFLGGSATLLGGFFASKAGPGAALCGMLAFAVLIPAAAVKFLGGAKLQNDSGPLLLPGISSSSMVIDAPKNRSLDFLANANEGEIQWDKEKELKKDGAGDPGKTETPAAPEAKPEIPKFEMPQAAQLWKGVEGKASGLNGNGFMKGFGNGGSAMGMGRLKDGLAGLNMTKTFANAGLPKAHQLGKTSGMKRAMQALKSGRRELKTASSNRAMGQLKFARYLSVSADRASVDSQAKQYSTDAFEQGKTIGGSMQGLDTGSGITAPLGEGAPGVTDTGIDGVNATPYQPQVDAARALDDNAAKNKNMGDMLKMIGMMLMLAGLALMAVGMALMSNPMTMPIGMALMAIGGILLGIGIALMAAGDAMNNKAQDQANQAKNQGSQIDQQYGQPDQGAAINDCSTLAAMGISTAGCSSGAAVQASAKAGTNDVHGAVEQEVGAIYVVK